MLRLRMVLIKLFVLFLFLQLISCSTNVDKVRKLYSSSDDSYLNPSYMDSTFKDVSVDICYQAPKLDPSLYVDSIYYRLMYDSYQSFHANFPIGIKLFSTVTKTDWIFFESDRGKNTIDYKINLKDGESLSCYLPDSLSVFQKQSKSDFLLMIFNLGIAEVSPDPKKTNKLYSTSIQLEYLVWNTKNGDLIAKDHIRTEMSFERLPNKWPYKNVFIKTAVEIFNRLPMFKR